MIVKKIIYFVSEDWYFFSHRLPLALAAKKAGFDVSIVTRVHSHEKQITDSGLKLIPLKLSRRGINPLKELLIISQLISIYKSEQPDIVHHVALKPVLYGSIAARLAKVPCVVNAMAGLGLLFSSQAYKVRIVRPFVRLIFRLLLNRKNSCVILQNPDDVETLCSLNILNKNNVELIRGSGVDTQKYLYYKEQFEDPMVILASRLLWDKGVKDFVDAAKILKSQGVNARFILIGEGDAENLTAIPLKQLEDWQEQGVVEWWGRRDDMPSVFAGSNIVCLPSFYGEGVPKVLIEAASCGRAIVTTDTPGCREIVQNNENGLLVPIRDPNAVAAALRKLLESTDLREKMGLKGRELVKKEFSLEQVNKETLLVYRNLLQ